MNVEEIKGILSAHSLDLKAHRVKGLKVFGSVARGQQTEASDIDMIVEFEEGVGLFELISLNHYLENLLGQKVDLVTQKGLKEHYRKEVLKEAVDVA